MSWVINDGEYPAIEGVGTPLNIFVEPAPLSVFKINNSYPELTYLAPIYEFREPLPNGMFVGDNIDYPRFAHLDIIKMGAANNALALINVSIPKSVKKIGEYAFCNTSLTSVIIAKDCTYHNTSFPDGCVINFYD